MCANLPLMSAVTAVLLLTQIPFDTAAAMRTATEEMAFGALPRNAKSTTTSFCSILFLEGGKMRLAASQAEEKSDH